jgi:hypothetical protein
VITTRFRGNSHAAHTCHAARRGPIEEAPGLDTRPEYAG